MEEVRALGIGGGAQYAGESWAGLSTPKFGGEGSGLCGDGRPWLLVLCFKSYCLALWRVVRGRNGLCHQGARHRR